MTEENKESEEGQQMEEVKQPEASLENLDKLSESQIIKVLGDSHLYKRMFADPNDNSQPPSISDNQAAVNYLKTVQDIIAKQLSESEEILK